MRIIAGLARGHALLAPKSNKIRPAADKVKGAIFNILGDIEGCIVADFFAGTGSVGLEALSRGAAKAYFIDDLPEALKLIESNIKKCRFEGKAHIIKGTIPRILEKIKAREARFDVVFVDPPYDKNLLNPALDGLVENKLVDAQTLIVIEHSPREHIICPDIEVTDERKYGQTRISFAKLKE
ncbi:16S rRNA (guanine(966)-N(2))-methyltransferase RsmD [bacterium]|nr:16S rRNA (guanine(966)-N(2))-methyltransferase RsmD [bacterium]